MSEVTHRTRPRPGGAGGRAPAAGRRPPGASDGRRARTTPRRRPTRTAAGRAATRLSRRVGAYGPSAPTSSTACWRPCPTPSSSIDEAGRIVLVNAQTESCSATGVRNCSAGRSSCWCPSASARGTSASATATSRRRTSGRWARAWSCTAGARTAAKSPSRSASARCGPRPGLLVVASIRDVSERKRAEAQLRKMEARYRTLVEGIPAVTFMAALDEGVNELYVSPQIEALLGFSQKEWLENPILWYTQLHPEDRDRWHDEFARTCATGEPFRSVYRFLARDGRVVWVHGEAKVVRDEDGRPLFLQGVAFDITAIKQAEEDLKALNQTLERRVAEAHGGGRAAGAGAGPLQRGAGAVRLRGRPRPAPAAAHHEELHPEAGRAAARAGSTRRPTTTSRRSVNAADRMRVLIDDLLAYSRVRTQGKEPAPTECAAVAGGGLRQPAGRHRGERGGGDGGRAADGAGRPDAAGAAVPEPDRQRPEVPGRAAAAHPRRRPARRRLWVIAVADNGIGIEAAVPGAHLRAGRAPAQRLEVPRQRHRPGDLRADRPAPRRADLGRLGWPRPGQHVLLHPARSAVKVFSRDPKGRSAERSLRVAAKRRRIRCHAAGSFTMLNQKCSIDLTTARN